MIDDLAPYFPLLDQLKDTPQDPEWHAEGDVETHTRMCLDDYENLSESLSIGPWQDTILRTALTLHDIGKAITTRAETIDGRERIISPRHANRGRDYVFKRIHQLDDLNWDERWLILSLVGHHHDWKPLIEEDRPSSEWMKLACQVPLGFLSILERADIQGRESNSKQAYLDLIHLFDLDIEDRGLREHPTAFVRDWRGRISEACCDLGPLTTKHVLARSLFDRFADRVYGPEGAISRSYQYRDDFPHLVVLCGPSGTGKSSYVANEYPSYERVSLDRIRQDITGDMRDHSQEGRVRQESKRRLKEHLRSNRDVVWDATNLRKDFRDVPLGLGDDYGAMTTLDVFWVHKEIASSRNQSKNRPVPDHVIDQQYEQWQIPYADEAHEVRFLDSDHCTVQHFIGGTHVNLTRT